MSVEQILRQNNIEVTYIHLGEIEVKGDLDDMTLNKLSLELSNLGFEVLDDQRMQLIEQIKTLIIQKVQPAEIEEHFSVSKYLTTYIYKDYSSISKLFSEVEGMTIEQFLILQKIEKAKELLIYKERSLSQISFNLGYSSTQHLSSQFKKLTGMTPSQFKSLGASHRRPLDNVKN